MKKYLLSTVALAALGTAASAADLAPRYTKAPPMVANPATNWTGFYAGLQAGALEKTGNVDVLTTGAPPAHFTDNFSKLGFLAGGQIGYNFQSGMSVFGVEADAAWVRAKTSADTVNDPFFFGKGSHNARFSSSIDWLVTVRGRAGLLATPALLLYATGGLAVADVKVTYQSSANTAPAPFTDSLSTTQSKLGWTAGLGAEYALGGNWSIKAEYLHVKLQDASLDVPRNPSTGRQGPITVHQDIDLIRAGLNYKFGGPMVARY